MLLFRPGRLADALRSGTLSEVAKARLMLAGYGLGIIFSRGSFWRFRTPLELLLTVVYVGLFLGGLWGCYRENAEADNRNFVERYICLSVPVGIWTYGGYYLSWYVAYFLLRQRPGYDAAAFPTTMRPYVLVAGIVVLALYFSLMRRYIRRAALQPVAS